MNYIDVKVTAWNRLTFSDYADMQELIKLVEQNGIDEVIDEARGFVGSQTLYETEEDLTPTVNGEASTIEIYEQDNLIWKNGKS